MNRPVFDLLDKGAFANGAPHEWFTWLRANQPIYRHPEPDGPGFWVLSKHADIVEVNRNSRQFSSDDIYGGPTGLTVVERQRMIEASRGAKSLPHMDPPEHTAHRAILEKRFRSRPIGMLEDRVRELTGDLLDRTLEKGACDFVSDVAAVVPVIIISELMGLPESDQARLVAMANANFGVDDPEVIRDANAYVEAREGMRKYASDLTEQRRAEPGDDVMTTLVNGEINGEPLSDQHIALFFELLVAAGHETTLTALSQGMNAFLDNPEQYRALVKHPELAKSATEEVLRWSTPVMYFRRSIRGDFDFHGHKFSDGESVTMWYISANRDEEVFRDPFAFDIARDPNNHLVFGGGGPHFCLGSRLARLEIKVFLEELAKRVDSVERLGPAVPLRSNFFHALKHLPVSLSATSGGCPFPAPSMRAG